LTKKKRRRPSTTARGPQTRAAAPPKPAEPQRRGFAGFLFRPPGPSIFPPFFASLGQGLLAVATTPVLLVAPFVLMLVVWLVLLALGLEASPGRLLNAISLAPVSVQFDAGTGIALHGTTWAFLVFVNGAMLVRAVIVSALAGVTVDRFEGGAGSMWAVVRGLRAFPSVLAMHIASFGLITLGNIVFLGVLGALGNYLAIFLLLAMIAVFSFVPIVAVREGRSAAATFRRAYRAARSPSGHLPLVILYFFLLPIIGGTFPPGGSDITSNPSFSLWVYLLFGTYLQIAFMATFAYRWIVAEPEVPEVPKKGR